MRKEHWNLGDFKSGTTLQLGNAALIHHLCHSPPVPFTTGAIHHRRSQRKQDHSDAVSMHRQQQLQ